MPKTFSVTPTAIWCPSTTIKQRITKLIPQLKYIRQLNLNFDTKGIHPNRLRQLSRLGARYEPFLFRRFKDSKKYAMLVAYLMDLSQDLIDQAFKIHDKLISNLQKKGKKTQDEIQKKNGKSINEKVVHFANLGDALIRARNEGTDPYEALESVMPWDNFVSSVEEAKKLSRPIDYDFLDLLENSFSYLRKYTPTLLKALEFRCTKATEPLLRALDVIREMNETGKRKVPEDAPLDFISCSRWQKHVYDEDGNINRRFYEMAALTELRNSVRSGDVSIVGSRQHKDFDEYIFSREEWEIARTAGTRLAVSLSVDEYLEERTNALLSRLNWMSKNIKDLEGVSLEKGKIHVERLEKNVPDEARQFSLSLYGMLPRIKLTELLIEVSSWAGFENQFIHASTGKPPHEEEKPVLMATLMAMGTNIGLTKMAEATPGVSYRQMANVAQWRMYEDAMNRHRPRWSISIISWPYLFLG
ncbi:MAG: Tn3 transposase DDE domain protein [Pelotomaculum sp. PtaB.Bin117]|nr:MAG: Tn3 transposase DDE domain protein [Pelotomaculum sp. PtaB.Bin117]OPY63337.1 MAG: Tn3 transposase DDE domain protein [Pelotomaculum sp. PtaU1.Bin065]